jgi:hypothetical protein
MSTHAGKTASSIPSFYDGPIFREPVAFQPGEKVFRTYAAPVTDDNDVCKVSDSEKHSGFHYIDLLPL